MEDGRAARQRHGGGAFIVRDSLFPIPFGSMQLESAHYMRTGDLVRHDGGRTGTVTEAMTLWATVRWDDGGADEEVEQLDPRIVVTERATRE
jgi:hypothetical protein